MEKKRLINKFLDVRMYNRTVSEFRVISTACDESLILFVYLDVRKRN